MKLPLILATAAAAMMLPSVATAHTSRAEERHDVRRAVRSGNEARIHAERRELRGARRELHEDARAFRRHHRRH
ncbi:MAG: hypothetical protein AABZ45_11865 [Pseudomonadota bacterium]